MKWDTIGMKLGCNAEYGVFLAFIFLWALVCVCFFVLALMAMALSAFLHTDGGQEGA